MIHYMQTSLRIEDALWAQVKDRAKADKRTVTAVVELALAAYVDTKPLLRSQVTPLPKNNGR